MTRKHYIELASVLKEHNVSEEACKKIAIVCKQAHKEFNLSKFMEACKW